MTIMIAGYEFFGEVEDEVGEVLLMSYSLVAGIVMMSSSSGA